jgi:hypothetical protein
MHSVQNTLSQIFVFLTLSVEYFLEYWLYFHFFLYRWIA